ncbi:hypothetical protein [Pleomorphovibrio marinus]|uniref:hypothetical protein n=1 Tax=Pleomorphovibrio marinus TaxID=2164132 RepID=UPI000E0B7F05|nr:hypothetical protein [Pleomorphovibrio marinus]
MIVGVLWKFWLSFLAGVSWFMIEGSEESQPYTWTSETYMQDPELQGPDQICINGSFVFAEYSAGGMAGDRYIWSITDANGFEIYYQSGGANVETIEFAYTSTGSYTVSLRVLRGGDQNFYSASMSVNIERGPRFALAPDYVICGDETIQMQAIATDDPNFGRYTFEWFNRNGTILGTENIFETNQPGRYYVKVSSEACEATGSTYAGPSIQVGVSASTRNACLGQTVSYRPDTPYLANWAYQKNGQAERVSLGRSFELDLDTEDDLEGLGDYTIFFNVEDPERPGCSIEMTFDLEVSDAAQLTVNKLQDSDGCDASDGAFEIRARSPLTNVSVSGVPNGNIGNLAEGGTRRFEGLSPGLYTISARRGTCTISRTVNIENLNLEEGIEFDVSATPQVCSPTGTSNGSLILEFEEPQSGQYRAIRSNGNVYSGNFENETSVTVSVPVGNYEVEVGTGDNCSSTKTDIYEVPGESQVNFSIPTDLRACQFYDLTPESNQQLSYTLTKPDGSTEEGASGDEFRLEQSGEYRLLAVSQDPDSPLCPRNRTFEVTINEPLEYDLDVRQIDCFGNQIFTAVLNGMNINDVTIRWMRENRQIVGRDREFFPPQTGNYILEVQPRASSRCEVDPIFFEVVIPDSQTDVLLEGEALCEEEPFTTLTLEADMELVRRIEWFKLDENGGDREWLFEFDDETSIDVAEEGVYEVVVRNKINCRLGSDTFEVRRVVLNTPEVKDTYDICSEEGVYPRINPGDFANYEWWWDGELLSEEADIRPTQAGFYELRVREEHGCEQSFEFEVIEQCHIYIRVPNALIPGHSEKDFKLYADPEVDQVEVFIYHRTGELIYTCKSSNNGMVNPLCTWDGFLYGEPLPPGTYPLVIKFSSASLGINKVLRQSLFVVN